MKILVCLEGSATSASASAAAIALARESSAELTGLAIVDVPDIVAGAATGIGGTSYRKDRDAALLADARAQAAVWLHDFAAAGHAAGVPVRMLELEGRPAEMILEELGHHDVAMFGRDVNFRFETQEHDRYTRDRILRRAGKPLIVVPAGAAITEAPVMMMYDGSAAAIRALRSFAATGLGGDRELHVATVNDDGADAFEMANRGCELLRREFGVTAVVDHIVSADPVVEALLARRAKLGAGMIVLGGYVPSPLARLVWGSVTHGVLEGASVPVFVHY
jgi:nucleotide-binding universal stress UspA family protein